MTLPLKQLVEKASASKRSKIMNHIATIAGQHSKSLSSDQLMFLSIIAQEVFDDAGLEILKHASQEFSKIPHIVPSLATKFASHTIEIADPMLRQSEALLDRDLVTIIKTKSDSHRLSIAHRKALSSLVTDTMLTYGNSYHALTMTRNASAQFSEFGFMRLAKLAADEKEVSAALSYRMDIPTDLAQTLNKQYKLPRRPLSQPDMLPKKAADVKPVQKTPIVLERDHSNFSPQLRRAIRETKKGTLSVDDVIPALCEADRSKELCQYLAGLCDLTEGVVSGSIFKLNGTKIAQICKAIDLPLSAFESVAMLRVKHMHLPATQADLLAGQYGDMDLSNAKRALASMQGKLYKGMARHVA